MRPAKILITVLFFAGIIFSYGGLIWSLTKIAEATASPTGWLIYGDTANAGKIKVQALTASETFGTEVNTALGAGTTNIFWTKTVHSPINSSVMVAYLDSGGTMYVLRCSSTCGTAGNWSSLFSVSGVTGTQTCSGTLANCRRPFDIAYEQLSGQTVIAYGKSASNDQFFYRVYNNATSVIGETSVSMTLGTAPAGWISLKPRGDMFGLIRTNEILATVAAPTAASAEVGVRVWSGRAWGTEQNITSTTNADGCDVVQCADGAWEAVSGDIIVVWPGTGGTDYLYRRYTNGAWGSEGASAITLASAANDAWVQMNSAPTSNRILMVGNEKSANDYDLQIWKADGSTAGWTAGTGDASGDDVIGQNAYGVWEKNGTDAIVMYGDASASNNVNTEIVECSGSGCTFTGSDPSDASATCTTGADDNNTVFGVASHSADTVMFLHSDIDQTLWFRQWLGSSIGSVDPAGRECALPPDTANTFFARTVQSFTFVPYSLWGRNWRFFDDETISDPSVGLNGAAENATPTDVEQEEYIRLRMQTMSTTSVSSVNSRIKLQWTTTTPDSFGNIASTSSWTDVADPTESTQVIRYATNTETCPACNDNTVINLERLTGSGDYASNHRVTDKDAAGGTNMDDPGNAIRELDYPLKLENVVASTTYYFRGYDINSLTALYPFQASTTTVCLSAACAYPSLKTASSSFEQAAYGFYSNADNVTPGSALAAQDTAVSLSSANQAFRLRLLLHIGRAGYASNSPQLKLQYAEMSGTCDTSFSGETYADVTSATVIAYNDNSSVSDGASLITVPDFDPVHSNHTTVIQTYEESNSFYARQLTYSGEDALWDFSLKDNGATSGTSYCFRVVKSDDSLIDTYTQIPKITTYLPMISSAVNQVFTYNAPATAISTITITDAAGGSITDANNLRVAIATTSKISMLWDTSDTTATFGGTASAKASNPVSYEGDGSVLLVPISSDFSAGETLTISGLSYKSFNAATSSAAGTIGLFLGGSGDKTYDDVQLETMAIKASTTLADHSTGQITDQWTSASSITAPHFRFALNLGGEIVSLSTTTFSLSSVSGVETSNFQYSNLYWDTDSSGTISTSTSQIAYLRPHATSSDSVALTANGCSGRSWDCVDDRTADDDTTYNYTNAVTLIDREVYQILDSTTTGPILNIKVHNRAALTSAGIGVASFSDVLYFNGNQYQGGATTTLTANGTYVNSSSEWTTNPETGLPWRWSEIDELEAGIFFSSAQASGREFRYTQTYISVTYCDSTTYDCRIGGEWFGSASVSGSTGSVTFATSTKTTLPKLSSTTVWTYSNMDTSSGIQQVYSTIYQDAAKLYVSTGQDISSDAVVWVSQDGMRWTKNIVDNGSNSQLGWDIIYNADDGKYVVTGSDSSAGNNTDAVVWEATDLTSWTQRDIDMAASTQAGQKIIYDDVNFKYVVAGNDACDAVVWESTSLTDWTQRDVATTETCYEIFALFYDKYNAKYITAGYKNNATTGNDAVVWESVDLQTWTQQDVDNGSSAQRIHDIIYNPVDGKYVAVGYDASSGDVEAVAWESADLSAWTQRDIQATLDPEYANVIVYDKPNQLYVVGGYTIEGSLDNVPYFWVSSNLQNWTPVDLVSGDYIDTLTINNDAGTYLAAGYAVGDLFSWQSGSIPYDFLLELSMTGLVAGDTITVDLASTHATSTGYVSDEIFPAYSGDPTAVTHTMDSAGSAPTLSNLTLNSGNNIILNEGTFKWATGTALITDADGCSTISSVTAKVYLASTSNNGSNCTQADRSCYTATCVATSTGNTCDADTTVEYDCGFKMWYISAPTDSGSQWDSSIWSFAATATDATPNTGTATNSTQSIEVSTLSALDVSPTINYLTLIPGDTSAEQIVYATSTGNAQIDVSVQASNNMCTDHPTCSGTNLSSDKQVFSLTQGFAYVSGTALSSTTASNVNTDITTPNSTTSNPFDIFYWLLEVPLGQPIGSYSGSTVFTAITPL